MTKTKKIPSPDPFLRQSSLDTDIWRTVVDLIARVAGNTCEVVLHDLADPVHSVIYVVNGHVTGRAVGQGFRHLVVEMLQNEAQNRNRDLLNDWWFEHEDKLIRSVTLLIRDPEGELIGALCVNQDVTLANRTLDVIKGLLPGLAEVRINLSTSGQKQSVKPQTEQKTQTGQTVLKTVFRLIDGIVLQARSEGETLTRARRLKVLEDMDRREVFLVKGAIEYVAQVLGVSKVTVYSDLDALHRQKNKQS